MKTLNKTQLQTIAVTAMVCDHFAWGFLDFFSVPAQLLHIIGRLTLPIMCFFIAEGFRHTSNLKRYIARMVVFAAISTVPFCLFFHEIYEYRQNIIFDLLLGLLLLTVLESKSLPRWSKPLLAALLFGTSMAVGGWVLMPMVYILIFYYKKDFRTQAKWFCSATVIFVTFLTIVIALNSVYHFSHYNWVWYDKFYLLGFMLALIPLSRYNHEKWTPRFGRLFFYCFYPAHFCILFALQQLAGHVSLQQLYLAAQAITMLAAFVLVGIVILSKPSRAQIGCLVLGIFTLVYLLGFWLEITSSDLDVCIAAVKVQYFGEVFLLIGFTLFIAEFCHRRFSKWIFIGESLFAFTMLICVFTLEYHRLFYTDITINYSGPFPRLEISYGIFFYLFLLYMGVVISSGIIVCIGALRESIGLEKRRSYCVILGCTCPWIATLLRGTGISGGYELASFGALGTIIFVFLALIKYGYFDSVQLATENAMNHSAEGIMVLSLNHRILYYNEAMLQIIPRLQLNINANKIDCLKNVLNQTSHTLTIGNHIYEIRLEPLTENNYVQGYMLWTINMTEHYRQLAEAESSAHTDDLTGLDSRSYFKAQFESYVNPGNAGSMFMLDLDNFKQVNDTYGHIVGDQILVLLAETLKKTAGQHLICRIGGDEFCMFFKDITGHEPLETYARRIIDDFGQSISRHGYTQITSVSIGIAVSDAAVFEADSAFDELYRRADRALYVSKNNGKNTLHFYQTL